MALASTDPNMAFVANTCNMEIDDQGEITDPLFKTCLYQADVTTADALLELEYEHIGTTYIQGILFSAEIIRAVGGFDEDLKGDDLIIRTKVFRHMITHPELTFSLIHSPGFQYRKHGNNIHTNRWRQVALVLEWRTRFFPTRPMPELWQAWVRSAIKHSLANHDLKAITSAAATSPEIQKICKANKKLEKYKKRHAQRKIPGFLRRLFKRSN